MANPTPHIGYRARQRAAALRGAPRGPAAELPVAVDGLVEFPSARLPADRAGRRRGAMPVLRGAFRPDRLIPRPAARMSRRLTVVQLLPAWMPAASSAPRWRSPTRWCGPGIARSWCPPVDAWCRDLRRLGAEHVTLDIGRKSPWRLRHVRPLRRLFADAAGRHRACAFALAGVAGADSRCAACAAAAATAFRHDRAWTQFAVALQRGDGDGRARDLRVATPCASTCCAQYPDTDPARLRVIPRGIDPADFPRASDGRHRAARARDRRRSIRNSAATGRCCCCPAAARA